jgi:hypothetical protein
MDPVLPSYKPHLKLEILKENDLHPAKLPFLAEDQVYLYSATSDKTYMNDPVKRKAWITNKIKGPSLWWLASISPDWHPNLKKVQALCEEEAPPSVIALYHPVWQFRLALGLDTQLAVDNAEFDWKFFWAKKKGLVGVKTSLTEQ